MCAPLQQSRRAPVTMVGGIFVVFVLTLVTPTRSQYEGDGCVKNGVEGTCRLLHSCSTSIRDLKRRVLPQVLADQTCGVPASPAPGAAGSGSHQPPHMNPHKQYLQTCSYVGMEPVVCCVGVGVGADADVVTAPTTARTMLTTTKRTTTTTEYAPPVYDYKFDDDERPQAVCEPVLAQLTSPNTGQIAWDKCIEYQEMLVYPCVKEHSLVGGVEKRSRVNRCSHDVDELIVGGANASSSEFPHMALLGFGEDLEKTRWLCGGSVISERYILTAAHCIYSLDAGAVSYARVGALSRSELVDSSQLYRIQKKIRHPGYKLSQKYNDIALLETDTEIALSSRVVPACLHVDTAAPDHRALATGWGATANRGSSADVLQKVVLKKFTDAECGSTFRRSRYMRNGFDPDTQICYGDKESSRDSCQGDSGGPLQLKSQRIHCMYTVVGITSFGRACGRPGQPAIYTRVSAFVPWIESIVWPAAEKNEN